MAQAPSYQDVSHFQMYSMQDTLMAWMDQRISLLAKGTVAYMNQTYKATAQQLAL